MGSSRAPRRDWWVRSLPSNPLDLFLLLLLLLLLRQRDRCCPKCLGSSEGYCGGSNAPRDARKMP